MSPQVDLWHMCAQDTQPVTLQPNLFFRGPASKNSHTGHQGLSLWIRQQCQHTQPKQQTPAPQTLRLFCPYGNLKCPTAQPLRSTSTDAVEPDTCGSEPNLCRSLTHDFLKPSRSWLQNSNTYCYTQSEEGRSRCGRRVPRCPFACFPSSLPRVSISDGRGLHSLFHAQKQGRVPPQRTSWSLL